jgi:hypothetical protein
MAGGNLAAYRSKRDETDRLRKPTRTQPESVLSGRVNEDL